jgi:hypothetical protein
MNSVKKCYLTFTIAALLLVSFGAEELFSPEPPANTPVTLKNVKTRVVAIKAEKPFRNEFMSLLLEINIESQPDHRRLCCI